MPGPTRITIGTPRARVLELACEHLNDFRGLTIGYLIMLRDTTEHEEAEARLLELRWAQAALHERELLAQELHDSLSQNLAFLNLQAQTAQLYLQTHQVEEAGTSLDRLAAVAREMQGDTRTLIGDLLSVRMPTEGFCSALRQIAARFEEQTGLSVSLEILGEAEDACDASALAPAVALQLLRIVQEALANVRKHAGHHSHTDMRLSAEDGQILLTVSDDGAGFEPTAPAERSRGHYGLQIMRRRAAQVGGQIDITSAPGQGTRIVMRAPLRRSPGEAVEVRSSA
jgi:signal transduction histidine kinase